MKSLIPLVLLAVLLLAGVLEAGECPRSAAYYIEALKSKSPGDHLGPSPASCLSCAGIPRKMYQRWGIEAEKAYLFSMRKSTYREDLISEAKRFLSDPPTRDYSILVLAFQGISTADSVDIFKELTERDSYPFFYLKWYALASLQDPRTINYAEKQYRQTKMANPKLNTESRDALMEIIDCLFHFPAQESRPLLKRIADQENDKQLRQYIKTTTGI